MQFVALLYDGIEQRFVREEAQNEQAFFKTLDSQYPCYVCLWHSVEWPAQKAIEAQENI